MKIAKIYDVPDRCPPNCPFMHNNKYRDICDRCPIYCCTKKHDLSEYSNKNGMFCIINPEEYRADWAKVWQDWFKSEMNTLPELIIFPKLKKNDKRNI